MVIFCSSNQLRQLQGEARLLLTSASEDVELLRTLLLKEAKENGELYAFLDRLENQKVSSKEDVAYLRSLLISSQEFLDKIYSAKVSSSALLKDHMHQCVTVLKQKQIADPDPLAVYFENFLSFFCPAIRSMLHALQSFCMPVLAILFLHLFLRKA